MGPPTVPPILLPLELPLDGSVAARSKETRLFLRTGDKPSLHLASNSAGIAEARISRPAPNSFRERPKHCLYPAQFRLKTSPLEFYGEGPWRWIISAI
jgi:hypothetical protein